MCVLVTIIHVTGIIWGSSYALLILSIYTVRNASRIFKIGANVYIAWQLVTKTKEHLPNRAQIALCLRRDLKLYRCANKS